MLLRLVSAIALNVASKALCATLPSVSSIQQLNASILQLKYTISQMCSPLVKPTDMRSSSNIRLSSSNSGPLLDPKIGIAFPDSGPEFGFEPELVAPLFNQVIANLSEEVLQSDSRANMPMRFPWVSTYGDHEMVIDDIGSYYNLTYRIILGLIQLYSVYVDPLGLVPSYAIIGTAGPPGWREALGNIIITKR